MAEITQPNQFTPVLSDPSHIDEPHIQAAHETNSQMTWDDVRMKRDADLHIVENSYNFDSPPAMIAAYKLYKQQLRDIIKDSQAAGLHPFQVKFPEHPDAIWQPTLEKSSPPPA
jgi:outer membrane PBP1 activator LpoA protein